MKQLNWLTLYLVGAVHDADYDSRLVAALLAALSAYVVAALL